MIIFLSDLQNSYYRYLRNSVPIGMGFVAAYLKKTFGDSVEIHQFRKFEELYDALKVKTPQLAAFGSYSWNTSLTRKVVQYIRSRSPDTIIAVGGPDISEVASVTACSIEENPAVDFFLPNEGEAPMRNLVEAVMGLRADEVRGMTINGCYSHGTTSNVPNGNAIVRFDEDINEIPSPYLSGLMDRFLADPDYIPIIQTARGCPYHCTFCVSGKDSWNRVKTFDMDRVKAEIDYIGEHAVNKGLRLADENFGLLKRDVEIAEYFMHKRRTTGRPISVSVYTDKHPTDRVKEINLMMRDLTPFCISCQTLTYDVLQNIKRVNLKDEKVTAAVEFAQSNDLMLVSEMIFALPGETVESFMASIDRLIDLRFESIAISQLRILKGTEMDYPEDRQKYDVETMFAMSENGYTDHEELENIEIDEWVVANNTLSRDEYFDTNKFIFLFDFGHFRGYLLELLFFFEGLGVRASRLLLSAVQDVERCMTVSSYAERFSSAMREMLHSTPEEAVNYVRHKMATDPAALEGIYRLEERLMIEMLMSGHLSKVVDEVAETGRRLYQEQNDTLPPQFDEQLSLIKETVKLSHIPLDKPSPDEIVIEAQYDLTAWVGDNYSQPLGSYRQQQPIRVGLRIRNPAVYPALWDSTSNLFDRHKRHFLTVNSSNRRRFITEPATG